MNIKIFVFCGLALFASAAIAAVSEKDFALFSEAPPKKIAHAKLQESDAFAKKNAMLFRKELKAAPNFAGKYRLVQIACGSACIQLAVVDCQSGIAYDLQTRITDAPGRPMEESNRIQFRKNSRLLVATGCKNEKNDACGFHQFEWSEEMLKPISFSPFH